MTRCPPSNPPDKQRSKLFRSFFFASFSLDEILGQGDVGAESNFRKPRGDAEEEEELTHRESSPVLWTATRTLNN